MKKLFYLLIATIVLISCGNGSKNKTETSIAKENQTNRVEVLYFHGAQRCITCRAIEANTVALLDSLYSKEQADGKIIFKVIDVRERTFTKNILPQVSCAHSIWANRIPCTAIHAFVEWQEP